MVTRGREEASAALEFSGTSRYEVRRLLGAGSFGVVYEAYDRARNSTVALKWLRDADADTIFRFKNEFRRLAEISHPNLVTLFDLESDDGRWFFTMELVRGVPVHTYLRPEVGSSHVGTWGGSSTIMRKRASRMRVAAAAAATSMPGDRLPMDVEVHEVRDIFRQLALAVHALHEAGKLHRDLKCQNVLVTPGGRVVLLDFGMVRDLGPRSRSDGFDIAGTPLYMSSEQCAGAPIGPPADWYAFGVMLFRALTGDLPFVGRLFEVMTAKQTRDGDAPSELTSGVPEDLDELCGALLKKTPRARPDGLTVLAAFGAEPIGRSSLPSVGTEVFVGRRRQLRALESARRRVWDQGLATAAYIHGPSGIGKTALVHHFLDRILADDPSALVLRGRCYERETLPYKALDSVVDDLMQQLTRWSDEACRRVVPPGAQDLVRVFPTLARVNAFREATNVPSTAGDPQEQRRRAVTAFEYLLHRVAERGRVVIFMDDLQWGDGDSAQLVRPLLHGPDDPPVLWIGTYRTETQKSGYLAAMHGIEDTDASTLYVEVPELERSPQGREAGLEALAALGLDAPESWLALLAPGDWSA